MIRTLIAGLLAGVVGAAAAAAGPERELRQLLDEFLAGASANDVEMHDRFWADDLVYTSSSGERFGKEAIMQGLADAPGSPAGGLPVYSARDVAVRAFEDIAVITFRLVAGMPDGSVNEYYNTGVFRHEEDGWKAFTWQATTIPESDR